MRKHFFAARMRVLKDLNNFLYKHKLLQEILVSPTYNINTLLGELFTQLRRDCKVVTLMKPATKPEVR